jgi:hypothetical protein
MTFSPTGAVEKISVVDELPDGLTEQAVKAARMMRFLPEEKDNIPVSTTKIIEYSFMIY